MDEALRDTIKEFLALWDDSDRNAWDFVRVCIKLLYHLQQLFERPVIGASDSVEEEDTIAKLRKVVALNSSEEDVAAAIPPWVVPVIITILKKALEKWLNR